MLLEDYILNASKDITGNRKAFHLKRKPDRDTLFASREISNHLKYQITSDPVARICTVRNLEENRFYVVDTNRSSCTCKYYAKLGYCKHVLFMLKKFNKGSSIIDGCERDFTYRGNTAAAKKRRGRVPHATSALHRM